jgi:hypothetical protein
MRSPARFGISDGATTTAVVSLRRQMTLDAVAARPRLVAQPHPHPIMAALDHGRACTPHDSRPSPCSRCGVLPDLAARAALGNRHDDPLLVNVKPDIDDPIPHDPSPMHEARRRPIRRNPRDLHTLRPVAPPSGGHLV